MITDLSNFSPPWTVLCPTPSISSNEEITGASPEVNCSNMKDKASSWFFTGLSNLNFWSPTLCPKNESDNPIFS